MKLQILAKAIRTLNPNAQFSVETINENDFNITWHNNTQPISKNSILAKQAELQNIEDNRIEQEQINKQSALTKLSALGLTEAEIKSIIG